MDNPALRCQIKELGNVAPMDMNYEGKPPESLKCSPVEDRGDMFTQLNCQQDDSWSDLQKIHTLRRSAHCNDRTLTL